MAGRTSDASAERQLSALRRLSGLLSDGAPTGDVLAAVADEVARVLDVECAAIVRGEPGGSGGAGVPATVSAPIVVAGRLWGAIRVPAAPDMEERLGDVVALVAPAIAAAESRDAAARLAAEQAALREVAALVALAVPESVLFAAVAEQIARVSEVGLAFLARYEPDGTATIVARYGEAGEPPTRGLNWRHDSGSVTGRVFRTGRTARMEEPVPTAGAPIHVGDRLWGVAAAASVDAERLPADVEQRLADLAALVGTGIANAEARAGPERVAAEEAALRRVATLVARDVPPDELFGAAAREVGTLLGGAYAAVTRVADGTVETVAAWAAEGVHPPAPRWSMAPGDLATALAQTRRPALWADWTATPGDMAAFLRGRLGVRASVACPIVVGDQLWGVLAVHYRQRTPRPPGTEQRLVRFAELVARFVANAEARAELARLAQQQAGLRRVATLVAAGGAPEEIFTTVGDEVGRLVGNDLTSMFRCEPGGTLTLVAVCSREPFPDGLVGTRLPMRAAFARFLGGDRPIWLDARATADWTVDLPAVAPLGLKSAVGVPIVVGGRPWGALFVCDRHVVERPPEAERAIMEFTQLVATAIANADARAETRRLAEEQAALHRVATLVAEEGSPSEVFARVAEELGSVLGDVGTTVWQDEGDGTATVVAVSGLSTPVGTRLATDGDGVVATVLREGRPVWRDDSAPVSGTIAERGWHGLGIRSAIGCPVLVGGRIWGALGAARHDREPFPRGAELRLERFAELAATAIGNAGTRAEVERLVEEQTALRRVATLVAEGGSPAAVFDAVAAEMATLLQADGLTVCRYEEGSELTIVAHRGPGATKIPPGTRIRHDDTHSITAIVRRTGLPARKDSYADTRGSIGQVIDRLLFRSGVGVPIVVDGRPWGVTVANWMTEQPPPPDTERRMAQFGELLDTAIANADSRDQLTASRARLLTAFDEARRRVVRDLHDGAQQRLVHAVVTLKLARRALREADDSAGPLVDEALAAAEAGNAELRELAHGILPAVLARGGLRAGVRSLAARLDLPVRVDVPLERFASEIEASAYFIVAEALTNVSKHARASSAEVRAAGRDGTLVVEVRDDGVGGADPTGHGLVGIGDRAAALGGWLEVESPPGGGTRVAATLPI